MLFVLLKEQVQKCSVRQTFKIIKLCYFPFQSLLHSFPLQSYYNTSFFQSLLQYFPFQSLLHCFPDRVYYTAFLSEFITLLSFSFYNTAFPSEFITLLSIQSSLHYFPFQSLLHYSLFRVYYTTSLFIVYNTTFLFRIIIKLLLSEFIIPLSFSEFQTYHYISMFFHNIKIEKQLL